MERDAVDFHLLAFVDEDAQLGAVGEQGVRLLFHGDVHVEESFLHVMLTDALRRHRLDVVIQNPACQQVDLALDRFLLRTVDTRNCVTCQPRQFLHADDQINIPSTNLRDLDLDVGKQILCPKARDGPFDVVARNVNFLTHLKRTEQFDGLHIGVLGTQHRQSRNLVGRREGQINHVAPLTLRPRCGTAQGHHAGQGGQPHPCSHQLDFALGRAPKRRSRC